MPFADSVLFRHEAALDGEVGIYAHSAYWASVIYHKTQELLLFGRYLNACPGGQRKPFQPFCSEEQYKILDHPYMGRGFLTWTLGWRKLVIWRKTRLMTARMSHSSGICLLFLLHLPAYSLYGIYICMIFIKCNNNILIAIYFSKRG